MSVLIFIDHSEGQVKKASLEALSYGAALAGQLGVAAEGILLGTVTTDLSSLGRYGVKKIHQALPSLSFPTISAVRPSPPGWRRG